jgi:NitT/TauT family transport system permease protein
MRTSSSAASPLAAAPASRARGTRRARRAGEHLLSKLALPLSFALLLVLWELAVVVWQPPSYILPAPTSIARALFHGLARDLTDRAGYWLHLASTLRGALTGYAIGCTAGILLGILVAEFKLLERILLPYAIGLQCLPKVAIAPLILIWFGFGGTSKTVLAALLTFFPLLINTFVGLSLVDRDYLLLLRSLRATRLQTLVKVKLPAALPMIFAGLDMSAVYAILGAIVAEFVGSDAGIGVMIIQAQFTNDTASVFAALTVLAVTGIILHSIVVTINKRLVFWTRTAEPLKVTS